MLLQRVTATAGEPAPKHDQALSNNIRWFFVPSGLFRAAGQSSAKPKGGFDDGFP
jgi:hypothetical protein